MLGSDTVRHSSNLNSKTNESYLRQTNQEHCAPTIQTSYQNSARLSS
jgi:hypothetical protein